MMQCTKIPFDNSIMLLYRDIKPQSLLTSRCDLRKRTGSTITTHFTVAKVDKQ